MLKFCVWKLIDTKDNRFYKDKSLATLKQYGHSVDRARYQVFAEGELEDGSGDLERVFYNINRHLVGNGASDWASVSDVLSIDTGSGPQVYYVDMEELIPLKEW